ncbi:MAG: hypothetical protein D6731_04100 [Planctomycetota bacterium]|nr:MAG: hypothetical protein D6731_04100 [Planctomycetota bacterium]
MRADLPSCIENRDGRTFVGGEFRANRGEDIPSQAFGVHAKPDQARAPVLSASLAGEKGRRATGHDVGTGLSGATQGLQQERFRLSLHEARPAKDFAELLRALAEAPRQLAFFQPAREGCGPRNRSKPLVLAQIAAQSATQQRLREFVQGAHGLFSPSGFVGEAYDGLARLAAQRPPELVVAHRFLCGRRPRIRAPCFLLPPLREETFGEAKGGPRRQRGGGLRVLAHDAERAGGALVLPAALVHDGAVVEGLQFRQAAEVLPLAHREALVRDRNAYRVEEREIGCGPEDVAAAVEDEEGCGEGVFVAQGPRRRFGLRTSCFQGFDGAGREGSEDGGLCTLQGGQEPAAGLLRCLAGSLLLHVGQGGLVVAQGHQPQRDQEQEGRQDRDGEEEEDAPSFSECVAVAQGN